MRERKEGETAWAVRVAGLAQKERKWAAELMLDWAACAGLGWVFGLGLPFLFLFLFELNYLNSNSNLNSNPMHSNK